MKKILCVGLGLLGLGTIFFFYFGFHTYFIENKVSEEVPEVVTDNVLSGSFVSVDAIHKGSGEAHILSVAPGTYVLRFEENFKVTNGPDLYVYLSNTDQPKSGEGGLGEYVDLGVLKGNMGSQNYSIPTGYENYKTAVIWCKKYGVLFSYAVLK